MLALLERDMRNIVKSLDALVAKDFAPDEKLRVHIHAVIGTYFRFPYLNRLLMRMVRDASPEVARKIADDYLRPISLAYAKLIEEGVTKGVFRPIDPQLFYFTVTGAADRFFAAKLVLQHCYGQAEMTESMRDDYADHTLDIIMSGLLTDQGA